MTTAQDFKEKVVLITGATSGIGEVAAKLFASQGARLVISGRREKEGSAVAEAIVKSGGNARFITCDVSNESDVKNLIASTISAFGKIDVAFNNAGVEQNPLTPLTETSNEEYRRVFDINVYGVWLCMKHEIQAMMKTGGGSIVNTSSIAGHIGMANASTYIASKHAVEGLTKSVALEVADKGIRINAVAPAAIDTDMLNRFAGGADSEMGKALAAMHPVGRVGRSEEVAQAVLYLASDRAGFTTGISLPVDGGYLSR